jgi:hypothetical protein
MAVPVHRPDPDAGVRCHAAAALGEIDSRILPGLNEAKRMALDSIALDRLKQQLARESRDEGFSKWGLSLRVALPLLWFEGWQRMRPERALFQLSSQRSGLLLGNSLTG